MHYVRNGDVRLAYRVYGDGETTVVWVPTMFSSIDRYDDPSFPWGAASSNSCREQLSVVVYDGRGTGLSDPVTRAPTLDDRVHDLSACSMPPRLNNAALFGVFTGGMPSLALAATDPDRVRSLILYATAARFTQDLPGFPVGVHRSRSRCTAAKKSRTIGAKGQLADLVFGASADVPGVREQWGRIQSSLAEPDDGSTAVADLYNTKTFAI